jgi:hypothetical protein
MSTSFLLGQDVTRCLHEAATAARGLRAVQRRRVVRTPDILGVGGRALTSPDARFFWSAGVDEYQVGEKTCQAKCKQISRGCKTPC